MSVLPDCPVCGTSDPVPVFDLDAVPVVCNQLWPDESSARAAPTGDVRLSLCHSCGFIWNRAFDADRMVYGPGYENALHFSPKFRTFADDLARHLVDEFDLAGRTVVEIGCGDGQMLDALVRHGAGRGIGCDPSMAGVESPFARDSTVEIVPEYFGAGTLDGKFDAVLCRHVLEHVEAPAAFLSDIRSGIGDRPDLPVYFEVPNAYWMLSSGSMWDVIYEHVGYWTEPAIRTAFVRAGFTPISVRAGYDGQFLMVEARASTPDPVFLAPGQSGVAQIASQFADGARTVLDDWAGRLTSEGVRAVIWGAGSKGVTFTNVMPGDACLVGLVDINQRKVGRYVPGRGAPVVAPETLRDIDPNLVLISNATYREEIGRSLRELGLSPTVEIIAG